MTAPSQKLGRICRKGDGRSTRLPGLFEQCEMDASRFIGDSKWTALGSPELEPLDSTKAQHVGIPSFRLCSIPDEDVNVIDSLQGGCHRRATSTQISRRLAAVA